MYKPVVFSAHDPLYIRAVDLRFRVLRQPLGLQFTDQELLKDKDDFHYGILLNRDLVACLTFSIVDQSLKMRQVAVSPEVQGQGWGQKLCIWAEQQASSRGFNHIFCHARMQVLPFYHRLGYRESGPEFMEVGIPHRFMEKKVFPD